MQNVTLNNLTDSMWCFQVALTETTRLGVFHYRSVASGTADHSLDNATGVSRVEFAPIVSQRILCYALDEFVVNYNLPLPNHIKIDVDGGEFEVLRGASSILQGGSIKTLLIEIMDMQEKDGRTNEIVQYLARYGYHVSDSISHNKSGGYPRVSDYLFSRR
jgi:FkbM family methyltransferase